MRPSRTPTGIGSLSWQLAEQLAQQTNLILRYSRVALTLRLKRQMQDLLGYGLALEGLAVVDV